MDKSDKWERLREWVKHQKDAVSDSPDEDAWGKDVMLERIEEEMDRIDAEQGKGEGK